MIHPRLGLFAALAALIGCGAPAADGVAMALFEVPREGPPPSGFYALPYPNDIRLTAAGTIDLTDHPRPNPIVENYVEAVATYQQGFSLSAPIFFRFTGSLDAGSLPAGAADSLVDVAAVYLVAVDPSSPRHGVRVPIKLRFEERRGEAIGSNWLSLLPFPGYPLEEGTTYAAVVTRRVLAPTGEPPLAAPDFAAIAGASSPTDPALLRARELYQPLWDFLDEPGGDQREDVIAATVFTTQDATALMGAIREVIHRDAAAPDPRDIVRLATEGPFAHYDGTYDGPIFQRGEIPYARPEDGGDIAVDPDTGEPVLQAMAAMRFSFTVPIGDVPETGWPVVIFAHGTGGSYHSFVNNGTAAALASEGIAAISIDQVLHGPRNPGGNPEIDFFNFQNPLSARDNTLQGALDDFQVVRLVQELDFSDPADDREVRFDADRIYYFGHSQGGLTGLPFVAYEPLVKGAVFSGAGGVLLLSLLAKTEPVDIAALVAAVVRDQPLDEFNPLLGLVQGYLDRADPVSFGRLVTSRPPPGNPPKHVFHSLGLIDNFTPVPSIEALATAMFVDPVAPVIQSVAGLELAGRVPLEAPVTGNAAGTTAVLLEYQAPEGRDGHFVLFDIDAARTQSIQFLATLAREGVATVVVP